MMVFVNNNRIIRISTMQSMINNALRILKQYNLRSNIYIDKLLAYLEAQYMKNKEAI